MIPVPQSHVTPEMTAWSKEILGSGMPIGASIGRVFDGLYVTAKVEIHRWIGATNEQRPEGVRGVTLYYNPPVRAEGVDVSDFQPHVDWSKVAVSGVSFAFVKATEGATVRARCFDDHWKGAKDAGLLRGAYHFFRSSSDPIEQVDAFLEQVGTDLGELPPVLDVEWQRPTDALGGLEPAIFAARVERWIDTIAETRRPILYTAPNFWRLLPGDICERITSKCDLWVAHYGVSQPEKLIGWDAWTFWQYSATKSEVGITARGDANVFNGTLDDLKAYSREVCT